MAHLRYAVENDLATVILNNPHDDQLKMVKESYPNLSDEDVLTKTRSQKLTSLIWTPIMDEFAKTHDVEPTEEGIQGFATFMSAMTANLPPEDATKMSAEMEREVYQPFVKNWKTSKALYEEFGGTVIFQQANPLEPVGAYRKLLETHEAKGNFQIYDERLKQQFWKYYVRKHPFQVPQKEIDYSKPWWLKQRTSDGHSGKPWRQTDTCSVSVHLRDDGELGSKIPALEISMPDRLS